MMLGIKKRYMIVLAMLGLVIFFSFGVSIQRVYAQGVNFRKTINLSGSPDAHSHNVQIAAEGSHVYVVWQEVSGGRSDILFRRSTNGGKSFGPIRNLTEPEQGARPRIAVSGKNVYVVWYVSVNNQGAVFFTASTDHGATFNPVKQLSDTPDVAHPEIAAFDDNVYVAWYGCGSPPCTNSKIFYVFKGGTYFTASTDGGATFSDAVELSDSEGWSTTWDRTGTGQTFGPQITAFDDSVYVAWDDNTLEDQPEASYEVFFKRSVDRGANFDEIVPLSDDPNFPESSRIPALAAFGSGVYVAWQQAIIGAGLDVFVRASSDGGANFAPAINISPDAPLNVSHLVLAAHESNVYAAWRAGVTRGHPPNQENVNEIFFLASTNGGDTFTPVSETPDAGRDSLFEAIAVQDGQVYVSWSEHPGEVLIRASKDEGTTFGSAVNVSNTPSTLSERSAIAVSDNRVYVVWTEGSPNGEAFFRVGTFRPPKG